MSEKTVEAYLSEHTDWRGDALRALDALVRETVPGVKAGIKWSQPVYESKGPMIFIKSASKHVTIGFWRGAELADPGALLEGEGDRMRHLKIRSVELPRDQLVAWMRDAVALNAQKGDPTRRK